MFNTEKAGRVSIILLVASLALGAQTVEFTAVADEGLLRLHLQGASLAVQRNLTFFDGVSPIGTAAAGSGDMVAFTAPRPAPGQHTIRAVEWGTGKLVASTTVTVEPQPLTGLGIARAFRAGITPVLMAAGDLSGRGLIDIVLAGEGKLAILHNAGNGDLAPPVTLKGVANPVGLAMADFDGDGHIDIAVIGRDGHLVLWRNGAMSETALGGHASSLAVADFNGDGIPDLAVSDPVNDTVTIWFGDTDGSFTAGTTLAVGISPRAIVAADFNGDGIADLATANFTSNDVTVLLGDGKGGFRPVPGYPAGNGPSSLATTAAGLVVWNAVDVSASVLKSDGTAQTIPDVLAVGAGALMATVSRNGQIEMAGSSTKGGPAAVALLVVDVNGDGIPDTVEADATGAVYVAMGVGSGLAGVQVETSGSPVFSTVQPNAILRPQASNYSLGTTSLTVGPAAGSGSVLLVGTGAWTATANATWLHLSAPNSSGSTGQLVVFTIEANPGATRSGTITFNPGALTLTVTQAGGGYVAVSQVTTLVSSGLSKPDGLAVDTSGNVYIADTGNKAVKEWNASTQAVSTLVSSGLSEPYGVAVDASGNVYIANNYPGDSATKKWNGSSLSTLLSPNGPEGVAVDTSGNVYVADTYYNLNGATGAIEEWNVSTKQVNPLVSSGLNTPTGVAVDASGNVYIADYENSAVKEWNVSSQLVTTLPLSPGVYLPTGVSVDGSGNVYVADYGHSLVKVWNVSTQTVVPLVPSGLKNPFGVAVDGSGNVYIADSGNSAIKMLPNAWVNITAITAEPSGGTTALPAVLPSSAPLTGIFAPASDQSWLTIGTVTNGVVNFSFLANTTGPARVAHITVLGQTVTVNQAWASQLSITKSHTDDFTQGQSGAAYSVTVSNAASAGPTSETVTVTENVPSGLTLVSMSGTGWTCPSGGNTCTRSDPLAAGASYLPITVTVNVASNAPASVTNQVTVTGGGSAQANASDPTNILQLPILTSPANTATGIMVTPTLVWSASANATSYDVYLGTSSPPPFLANVPGTIYTPAALSPGTTYYWQIVAKDSAASAASAIWSFTTQPSPFFSGAILMGSGIYYLQFPNGTVFGYFGYLSGGWIYHQDLGYESVLASGDSSNGVYFWDLSSSHWLYTSPGVFPYLYDFTLNAWLYYFPNTTSPGHYTTNPRWFANMTTGKTFTM